MEFHDFATKETAALISRLLASRWDTSVRELHAFRQTVDLAVKEAEKALAGGVKDEDDEAIEALVTRLTAVATAHADACAQHAATVAQAAIDARQRELHEKGEENGLLAASLSEMRERADALGAALQTEKDHAAAARAELKKAKDAHARIETARQEADEARQRTAREKAAAERELETIKGVLDSTRAESAILIKQLETEEAERSELMAEYSAAQAQLDAAVAAEAMGRQQAADAERSMEQARKDVESARQAARQAANELGQVVSQADARRDEAKGLRDQLVTAATQPLDRLLTTFQRLATSQTLADVLTALVDGTAQEFTRVALFNVNGSRLEGVRQVGFDFESDMSKLVVPLNMDSVLTQAVKSGQVQGFTAGELTDSSRALFGGTPDFVLVLPIAVREEIFAVLYADDSGQPPTEIATPERKLKFAELLLWHAAFLLPKFLLQDKAFASLRDYATRLVAEIEGMYSADRKAAKDDETVRRRLQDHLQYARQMYAQRSEGKDPAAATLLEQHIASIIKSHGATPFGRDMAVMVAAAKEGADGAPLQPAAEA